MDVTAERSEGEPGGRARAHLARWLHATATRIRQTASSMTAAMIASGCPSGPRETISVTPGAENVSAHPARTAGSSGVRGEPVDCRLSALPLRKRFGGQAIALAADSSVIGSAKVCPSAWRWRPRRYSAWSSGRTRTPPAEPVLGEHAKVPLVEIRAQRRAGDRRGQDGLLGASSDQQRDGMLHPVVVAGTAVASRDAIRRCSDRPPPTGRALAASSNGPRYPEVRPGLVRNVTETVRSVPYRTNELSRAFLHATEARSSTLTLEHP